MITVGLLSNTGFIGAALARALAPGGLDVHGASSRECDLLDAAAAHRFVAALPAGARLIVTATINKHVDDSFAALEKNLRMVEHLVSAPTAARLGGVIFLSSVDVYGLHPPAPITERTLPAPAGYYAAAKLASEALLQRPGALTCPVTILRLPGIYGPADDGRSVVGGLLRRLLTDAPLVLRGGGTARRDYVAIEDVCAIVAALVRRPCAGVLNVATGASLSVRAVIEVLARTVGVAPRFVDEPAVAGAAGDLVFDVSALRAAVPDFTPTRLTDGAARYAAALQRAARETTAAR